MTNIADEVPGINDWGIPEGIVDDIRRLSEDTDFIDSVSREISIYELIRMGEFAQISILDRKEHADDMIKAVNVLIKRFSIIEKYDSHNPMVRNQHSAMMQYWITYRERLDSVTGRTTKQKAVRILAEQLLPIFRNYELERKLSSFMIWAVRQMLFDKTPPSETLIKNILKELKAR